MVPRGSLGASVGFNDAQLPADRSDASISARLNGSATNVAAKRFVLHTCSALDAKLEVGMSAFSHIMRPFCNRISTDYCNHIQPRVG